MRDIGRAYRDLRGNIDGIVGAMQVLEHAGWVMPADGGRRDSERWLVNPSVREIFADAGAMERARRAKVKAKIQASRRRHAKESTFD
jgi:hypothetical protein